jgi:hypothetical protein
VTPDEIIKAVDVAPKHRLGLGLGPRLEDGAPDHDSQVEPALACPQIGDICGPLLVWTLGREVLLLARGLQRFTESTITKGDALKTELKKIRKRGFSIDEGEHQPGMRCIGASIRNQAGQVFAGLSISGPAWQLPISEADDFAKAVMHHANSISQRLGYKH